MKKVEVYFLINLGAILSLFAIEGELAKYKRKQGDILLEVAKDKLEAMVDVNNINSLNSDSLYKFTFDLEGEYDKESVDVTAEFNLNDTTALNDELNLFAKALAKMFIESVAPLVKIISLKFLALINSLKFSLALSKWSVALMLKEFIPR